MARPGENTGTEYIVFDIIFQAYYKISSLISQRNSIDPYHSMSKQKILPVEPLIQCEAGRAKTMQRQSLYSPRTPKWPPSDKGELASQIQDGSEQIRPPNNSKRGEQRYRYMNICVTVGPLTHWHPNRPKPARLSILLCLTPDDFTRQWGTPGSQWVN